MYLNVAPTEVQRKWTISTVPLNVTQLFLLHQERTLVFLWSRSCSCSSSSYYISLRSIWSFSTFYLFCCWIVCQWLWLRRVVGQTVPGGGGTWGDFDGPHDFGSFGGSSLGWKVSVPVKRPVEVCKRFYFSCSGCTWPRKRVWSRWCHWGPNNTRKWLPSHSATGGDVIVRSVWGWEKAFLGLTFKCQKH